MDGSAGVYQVSSHVKHTVVDGQAVLMDLRRGVYFGLDDTGTRIWGLLADARPRTAIVEALAAVYAVDPQRLGADVDRFIGELLERRLIEAASGGREQGRERWLTS